MIENVIFDLDGTLLDTRDGIIESVKHTAEVLGYKELPYTELLSFVGPPIQQSFMTHYGCDEDTAQEAAGVFRDYYRTAALLKAVPYEGVYELCRELKNHRIRMSVATYKREDYALTLLRHFRFDEYCDPIHGADGENKLKKKDIVQMCMGEMGAEHGNTVLIGDTEHDQTGAKDAGIGFIAVTYGFGFRKAKDVGECIGVAETPVEIAEILL